jgi:hypothetical protein
MPRMAFTRCVWLRHNPWVVDEKLTTTSLFLRHHGRRRRRSRRSEMTQPISQRKETTMKTTCRLARPHRRRAADITPAETREHLHSMNRDEAVEALLKMFVGASGPYRYFQSMATPTKCSIDASDRAKTALEVNETVH